MLTALALAALGAIVVAQRLLIAAQRRLIANLRSLAATQERCISIRDEIIATHTQMLGLLEDHGLWWELAARGWQDRAEELGHE